MPPWSLAKYNSAVFFMRTQEETILPQMRLVSFFNYASVLKYCVSIWSTSCTKAEQQTLQGVIKTAGKLIRAPLLNVISINTSCCQCSSHSIIRDESHPVHQLFDLLPSGKRYRSIQTRTTRLTL